MHNSEGFFEKVVKENKHKIYRICRIYAVSPVEPEDLFQDVIFELWKSLPNFKGNSSIDTWVYRIALNVGLRSKLKFEKKKAEISSFDAIQFVPSETIDSDAEERFELLKACITQLNESDKSIIVLYLDDLPYKEIATITGLTENNVAVKMKRIRKKLMECIKKNGAV